MAATAGERGLRVTSVALPERDIRALRELARSQERTLSAEVRAVAGTQGSALRSRGWGSAFSQQVRSAAQKAATSGLQQWCRLVPPLSDLV
jgi:hypothetical protein